MKKPTAEQKARSEERRAKSLSFRIAEGFDKGSTSIAHQRDIELCNAAPELLKAANQAADLIALYQARGSTSDRHALNIAAADCTAAVNKALGRAEGRLA